MVSTVGEEALCGMILQSHDYHAVGSASVNFLSRLYREHFDVVQIGATG